MRGGQFVGQVKPPQSIYDPLPDSIETVVPAKPSSKWIRVGGDAIAVPQAIELTVDNFKIDPNKGIVTGFGWPDINSYHDGERAFHVIISKANNLQQQPWSTPRVNVTFGQGMMANTFFVQLGEHAEKRMFRVGDRVWWRFASYGADEGSTLRVMVGDDLYSMDLQENSLAHKREVEVAYVTKVQQFWVAVLFGMEVGDERLMAEYEAAALSLRLAVNDEILAPYDPVFLIEAGATEKFEGYERIAMTMLDSTWQEPVLAYLMEAQGAHRLRAIQVLSYVAGNEGYVELRRIAVTDFDSKARDMALKGLETRWPSRIDPVEKFLLRLSTKYPGGYRNAAQLLARMKPDKRQALVNDRVLESMEYVQLSERAYLLQVLTRWGTQDCVPLLLELLALEDDASLLRPIYETLGRLKSPEALPALSHGMYTSPTWAAKALTSYGPEAEEAVLDLLSSSETSVRHNAINVLEKIGGQKSLRTLGRLSARRGKWTDPMAAIAKNAVSTIRKRVRKERRIRNQKEDPLQTPLSEQPQLGEFVTAGDYAIQPPRDFALVKQGDSDTSHRWMASAQQPGGPMLQLSILPRDKKMSGKPRVMSITGGRVQISGQQVLAIPGVQTESVALGGFSMIRAFVQDSHEDQGITRAYTMYDADHWVIIQLKGVDDDPESLALLEASAASFQLANPPQGNLYPIADMPPLEQEPEPKPANRNRSINSQRALDMRPPAQQTQQGRPMFRTPLNR